jgi:hypothetical protein
MTRDDGSVTKLRQSRHPDKSILLAYIRRQLLDDRLYIQQHVEHCERCSQQCDEYKRLSSLLEDTLMQVRHFYPRLTSDVFYGIEEDSYESGKLRAAQGQSFLDYRPTRRMARLRAAISLVLLFAMLLTTVAYAISTNHTSLLSHIPHHSIASPQPSPNLENLVPPPQVTTKHKRPSKPVVVPTPVSIARPSIVICGISITGTSRYLKICGDHFTPGDKVTIVLEYLKNSKSLTPVIVDATGHFENGFTIACGDVPIMIHVSDKSHRTESAMLIDIPRGCTLYKLLPWYTRATSI